MHAWRCARAGLAGAGLGVCIAQHGCVVGVWVGNVPGSVWRGCVLDVRVCATRVLQVRWEAGGGEFVREGVHAGSGQR